MILESISLEVFVSIRKHSHGSVQLELEGKTWMLLWVPLPVNQQEEKGLTEPALAIDPVGTRRLLHKAETGLLLGHLLGLLCPVIKLSHVNVFNTTELYT